MYSRIRRTVSELKCSTSGNATLLVALGMPALIGGAGLAVDTAQWYMWKRELQYAADQSALAAAWAMTEEETADIYEQRAEQEFAANLSVVKDFATEPSVAIEDYAGGDQNSVVVSASATKRLPFSSFLTGNAATIYASAQATFADGATYSACIIATSETEEGAITLQGNVTLAQSCGMAALSKSKKAIVANGSALDLSGGTIVSAGGIDNDLDDMEGVVVREGLDNLFDPYNGLTAPEDQTAASYQCNDVYETSDSIYYTTYSATNYKKYIYASSPTSIAPVDGSTWSEVTSYANTVNGTESAPVALTELPSGTKSGTIETTSTGTWNKGSQTGPVLSTVTKGKAVTNTYTWTRIDNSVDGKKKYYESKGGKKTVIDTIATLGPGTYTGGFWVKCNTTMSQGIYVIDGGTLKVNSDDVLTGDGVMIVLKNGATISINGGAGINLTPMSTSQLETVYATHTDIVEGSAAASLAGMLIMEKDPGTSSLSSSNINGNSGLTLNGTVYLPYTELDMSGSAGVSSQCLLLTASKVKFSGNMTFTSLCPDDEGDPGGVGVSSGSDGVKLVA